MTHQLIKSLHSPHVERVKALLGSRGKKIRREESLFIADGMQSIRSALMPKIASAPLIEKIYLTESGEAKLRSEFSDQLVDVHEIIPVTDEVMAAMADTQAPQGILALCRFKELSLTQILATAPKRIAFFWQIQDPGNAGTAIRTADACGFDAILFSEGSVDIYSPKVVRSTAGSLWHIPVAQELTLSEITELAGSGQYSVVAFDGTGDRRLEELPSDQATIAVFGNEARGLPTLPDSIEKIRIPMSGFAESLNVASAAAIALYHLGNPGNR
jgi:TrmH family RNA methyltransferase